MARLGVLGFLVVATTLEAFGDAIVRVGLKQQGMLPRAGCCSWAARPCYLVTASP